MKREIYVSDNLTLETSGTIFYIRQRSYGVKDSVITLTQSDLDRLIITAMKMSLMRDIEDEEQDNEK